MKCENKKRYGNLKNAERGRMNLWGSDPTADLGDLHVYKCPECGFFHVGHKSRYEAYLQRRIVNGTVLDIGKEEA